ncbi:MAG: hypothetical protein O3B74_02650 [Proteobacteria bacterium]|nr:hypothetical protein [Pseudomonadota bacterium]
MAHAIIRGANGRRHAVEFEDDPITISLHASVDVVELIIEAADEDQPPHTRRLVHVNMPRHLLSKAMADLARQDRQDRRKPKP